jgi:hypothetical protein
MVNHNYCLGLNGNHKLVQQACNGSKSQQWKIEKYSSGKFMLKNHGTGKYLDVPRRTFRSVQLQVYPSNRSVAQIFKFSHIRSGNYEIKNVSSHKCVDVPQGRVRNNYLVWQYRCNRSNAQGFKFVPIPKKKKLNLPNLRVWQNIQLMKNRNYCLAVNRHNKLIQNPCDGDSKSQQWKIEKYSSGKFMLKNHGTGKYLDVPARTRRHVQLQVYRRNRSVAQIFYFSHIRSKHSFEIKNVSSHKCVDVPYGRVKPNSSIWQHTCNRSNAQEFKFVRSKSVRKIHKKRVHKNRNHKKRVHKNRNHKNRTNSKKTYKNSSTTNKKNTPVKYTHGKIAFNTSGTIRNQSNGKCFVVDRIKNKIKFDECNESDKNQKFTLKGNKNQFYFISNYGNVYTNGNNINISNSKKGSPTLFEAVMSEIYSNYFKFKVKNKNKCISTPQSKVAKLYKCHELFHERFLFMPIGTSPAANNELNFDAKYVQKREIGGYYQIRTIDNKCIKEDKEGKPIVEHECINKDDEYFFEFVKNGNKYHINAMNANVIEKEGSKFLYTTNGNNKSFELIPVGGNYRIKASRSNKCLSLSSDKPKLKKCNDEDNQVFTMIRFKKSPIINKK